MARDPLKFSKDESAQFDAAVEKYAEAFAEHNIGPSSAFHSVEQSTELSKQQAREQMHEYRDRFTKGYLVLLRQIQTKNAKGAKRDLGFPGAEGIKI